MDIWTENGPLLEEHASPIRIDRVRPLGTGRSELELTFFHACYPEGVQEKIYRLRILHRVGQHLIAVRVDADDCTLRFSVITRAWLALRTDVPMLLALASSPTEDFGAQLDRIVATEVPPELRVPFFLPWNIEETMMHCALRFDGYAWLDAHPDRKEERSPVLPEDGLRNLVFDPDVEVNFTAFFMLQRFLGKWGGEMLQPSDKHHTAYRFLFLHLHALPTPPRWAHGEYERTWQAIPPERVAAAASAVRRVLLAAELRRNCRGEQPH